MIPERRTAPALLAIQDELIAREPLFHHPEHGTTREAFAAMTSEDFWETGASGRRYGRAFVIDTLVARYATPHDDDWRTEDFHCQQIAPDNYLLTYTLHQGARVTRRATLWRRTLQGWQAVYHQGTLVEAPDAIA